jgi:hypothetical protein
LELLKLKPFQWALEIRLRVLLLGPFFLRANKTNGVKVVGNNSSHSNHLKQKKHRNSGAF